MNSNDKPGQFGFDNSAERMLKLQVLLFSTFCIGLSSGISYLENKSCDKLKSNVIIEIFSDKNSVLFLSQSQRASLILKCETFIPIIQLGAIK